MAERKSNDVVPALTMADNALSIDGVFRAHNRYLEVLDDDVPFEAFEVFIKGLRIVEEASKFNIGDALLEAQKRWGDSFWQLLDTLPWTKRTCINYMSICNRVSPAIRKDRLTFSHHGAVASLDPEDQRVYLQEAADFGYSVRELRQVIRERKVTDETQEGEYDVIYLAPEWGYGDEIDNEGITPEEVWSLPIPDLASDKCALFLWVTSPLLQQAFHAIERWGFDYQASFVWDRIAPIEGQYNRVRHELLLMCGCDDTPVPTRTFQSVVHAEDQGGKPPYRFREMIEGMFPYVRHRLMWGLEAPMDGSWRALEKLKGQ